MPRRALTKINAETKPVQVAQQPQIQPQKPVLASVAAEGFSFGIGSSLAHAAVNRFFNSLSSPKARCDDQRLAYESCILNEGAHMCQDKNAVYTACINNKISSEPFP
jgi:hypothetical protein